MFCNKTIEQRDEICFRSQANLLEVGKIDTDSLHFKTKAISMMQKTKP